MPRQQRLTSSSKLYRAHGITFTVEDYYSWCQDDGMRADMQLRILSVEERDRGKIVIRSEYRVAERPKWLEVDDIIDKDDLRTAAKANRTMPIYHDA